MKPRYYVIIGLLFLAVTLLWVDKITITRTQEDAEMFWENRSQRNTNTLTWYDATVKTLELELVNKGMTIEEIVELTETSPLE